MVLAFGLFNLSLLSLHILESGVTCKREVIELNFRSSTVKIVLLSHRFTINYDLLRENRQTEARIGTIRNLALAKRLDHTMASQEISFMKPQLLTLDADMTLYMRDHASIASH